jgi:ankyrin repeat protein
MTKPLPANPSLENLKKQAKALQRAWAAGKPDTLARIRDAHPHYARLTDAQLRAIHPRLTDCQLVLAREFGYASWPQLRVAIQTARQELPDRFVSLACLCHDDPHYDHRDFHAHAHDLLSENPWFADTNIWSAAAAGNVDGVGAILDERPELVNTPGPYGWTPLICACYSRVAPIDPSHSTFGVGKLLLDRGADANTFTLKGNADERLDQRPRRFTALTGVFGGGSTGLANQPPHPHWREFAELLLSRGANPADEMALHINQDASLDLLLRHGLKPDALGHDGVTLMGRALTHAARRGNVDQVRLLLLHGALTGELTDGKLAWDHAMRLGRVEIARLLEAAGAPTAELDEIGQFISLCMAGDESAARPMLQHSPDLVSRAPKHLVHRAVWTRRIEAVKLTLDLGFDPNHVEDNAAIHLTGVLSERDDILRLLLDRGASLKLRDPWYDSTAIGWADFFDCAALRDTLLDEPGICLFDALEYRRFDRVPDILARDPAALERPWAECLTREPKPNDWQTPLVRMVVGGNIAAVRVLLAHDADRTARHPDGRALPQLALDLGHHDIAKLL